MSRNIANAYLTKDYILSKVSQVTIFSYYFNISVELINRCAEENILIKSPIREDWSPSCGFKYDTRGKLKFRDFGGYFWGDCFDAAALIINQTYKLNLNPNNKQDFVKILKHITLAFKNIFYGAEKDENLDEQIKNAINYIRKEKSVIDLVVRNWNQRDINYWNQFGIDIKFLNINFVYPVEQYYINRKTNNEPKYYYDTKDPCYAYFLGKDRSGVCNFKLYFPLRNHNQNRFITNCNHLEGILNLDKDNYDYIVITKSSKDRISLSNTLLNISSLYGGVGKSIGVINIPHETYKLRQIEYDWLRSKVNNNGMIFSLMDNDRTGKYEAIWLNDSYNIEPLLIPKSTHCKDFSELFRKYKIKYVYDLILNLINTYKPYVKRIQRNKRKEENTPLPF